MKIVINECYGGLEVSDWAVKKLHLESRYRVNRTNEALIKLIEEFGDKVGEGLEVVELPENTTDWMVISDDGYETIYYVVDGKIHML